MDFGKTQIGNMTFVKYKKGDLPFIKVSTVSGDFSVEYGAGSMMFMLLDNTPIEDKVDNLPMLIVRNVQYVANCIDVELQVDVLKAIGSALDRADAKPISDEEDAKIIEEERQMYEMKKEMGEDGQIKCDSEEVQKWISPEDKVSMNMWAGYPEFLDFLAEDFKDFLANVEEGDLKSEYLLPNIVDKLLKEERANVKVLETQDRWFGVTYKETVQEAFRELISDGVYAEKLWE